MARKSQHTFSKRQREQRKAEKAAQKRTRRNARKDAEAGKQHLACESPLEDPDGDDDDSLDGVIREAPC